MGKAHQLHNLEAPNIKFSTHKKKIDSDEKVNNPINEKDLDQDDENIEHQSDQSVLGPGCTSNFSTIQVIHDIDSGYDPDRSEEEKSDHREIDKYSINGIIRASYRRKKITNKENHQAR